MVAPPCSRADLHCHSAASATSKLGVQRALGLPECATPPELVYEQAKRRGMDFVTITDHDTIAGALELADRPDVFVSEELTAWFRGEPQAYGPDGPPDIVLLHGLAASQHVWAPAARLLQERGFRVVVPDLLGFGDSRRIGTRFLLDDHVDALASLLEATGAGQPVVVGHSFGCAVAVAFARAHPHAVSELVLVAPPVFRDGQRARERLGEDGWLARQVVAGSPVASLTCGLMCLLRPLAEMLVTRLADGVPREVAHESVQHSWPAYRDALTTLLDSNPLPGALKHPTHPTTVVLADADLRAPKGDVLDHPHEAVTLVELTGDHLFVYADAPAVAAVIAATTTAVEDGAQ